MSIISVKAYRKLRNMHVAYTCEKGQKSSGVLGGPLSLGRSGALTSPLLNPAFLWSGAGAERVKKSNERSRAVSGVQKIKWSVSVSGAVTGTIVNGAQRLAGNFAAPLTCSGK